MIHLTDDQRRELLETEPAALDPQTQEVYVLVPKPIYDRMCDLLGENVRASGELVDKIMAADDANDPYLESYQAITREKKP